MGRFCFVFETGPHIAQVGLIAKDNLELLVLLAVPLEHWENRHMRHAGFIESWGLNLEFWACSHCTLPAELCP